MIYASGFLLSEGKEKEGRKKRRKIGRKKGRGAAVAQ